VGELLGAAPKGAEALALALRARIGLLSLSGRLELSDEEFELQLREARELARASGDEEGLARVLVASAQGALLRTDPLTMKFAQEAYAQSKQVPDVAVRAAAAAILGLAEASRGSVAEAERLFEEVERVAADDPSVGAELTAGMSPFGIATAFRGKMLGYGGRPAEGLEHALRVARKALREKNLVNLMLATGACVDNEDLLGAHGQALPIAQALFEMAETSGADAARVQARLTLGVAWFGAGEPDRAIEVLEPALSLAPESHPTRILVQKALGDAYWRRGDLDRAGECLEHALTARKWGGVEVLRLLVMRAGLSAERDGAAAADTIESDLLEARALVERTEALGLLPSIVETEALAARLVGDEDQRRAKLAEARRLYTEMGATAHADRIAHELEGELGVGSKREP
jgi:tetratricopeptide (TPR) repeat protein